MLDNSTPSPSPAPLIAYSRKVPTPVVHQQFGNLVLSTAVPRRAIIKVYILGGAMILGALALILFTPTEAQTICATALLLIAGLIVLLFAIFGRRHNHKATFWIYERGMIVGFQNAAEEIPYEQMTEITNMTVGLLSGRMVDYGKLIAIDFRFAFYVPGRKAFHFHLLMPVESDKLKPFLRVLETMSSHLPPFDYSAEIAEHLERVARGE